MSRVNYLNNRDLLKEIHKSKTSYSSYTEEEYHYFDIILPSVDKINVRTIAAARKNRAARLAHLAWQEALIDNPKAKIAEFAVNTKKIPKTDLMFRIMSWDHIPEAPGRKKNPKNPADFKEKVNFPPFQHYKFDKNDKLICVGKSHWVGGIKNGHFSVTNGNITNKLALMFMKLCERYGTRSNWRGYCVDESTEALTQRGWLGIDEINEEDKILSYDQADLKWSNIKSIYRGEFDGLMHKITTKTGIDMLITPEHKLVTGRGLIAAEYLLESDKIILMGNAINDIQSKKYPDEYVELIGWVVTEGNYSKGKDIRIYQNIGPKADRIRNCLVTLGLNFKEKIFRGKNIGFSLSRADSKNIINQFPDKNLNMDFILGLTIDQRELLINTMIDGDGWRTGNYRRYVQKDKKHIDLFQALCAMSGHRSNTHLCNHLSYNKPVSYYNMNLFTKRKNQTNVAVLDFHGGKDNGRNSMGSGKATHPNRPTTYYKGQVWCPETEYGSFMARRNGTVYLTGNTYNDEMKNQALLHLIQIGLQFDENKSANPFAYYTASITNSFTRILNIEKKHQDIRDDILEMNNKAPSYTRQGRNNDSITGSGSDHD